ncbi:MAG: glycoside hydrolase family 57 protein [Rhodocyclaceae bacterium]|nr:glycoside hydrolase family 57 protein [Rhodocyclaceae bacterium]
MTHPDHLDLVFLWHMHQPDYRDRLHGEFILPWTYLHAIKDYTDMVAHLERHPQVHAVVNFVPVLLEQIEDYVDQFATGQFRDPILRLMATEDLDRISTDERHTVLDACFRCNHSTMLMPFPRFRRLYDIHQHLVQCCDDSLSYLSGSYYSDLLCWYHLVWMGESERRRQPLLAEMMAKGAGFSFDERQKLLELMGEIMAGIVPRYRVLAESGQIEISATPYSHPLAPLLLDLRSARESLPEAPLPQASGYAGGRNRVQAQIALAMETHETRFGKPPVGMWPAEGALSQKMLELLAEQGCRWTASSESVLANSLRASGGDLSNRPAYLYHPWQSEGAPGLSLFFRDERLSDFIGFEYSKWHGRDAALHFVSQLEGILDQAPQGSPPPLICVMLDGENAWEHYPYNGYYFFEDLYSLLQESPRIHTTTFAEYLSRQNVAPANLPRLTAGSWVYGTFSTWIGDTEKNRAWDVLCAAKDSFDRMMGSGRLSDEQQQAALTQLAVCESSDWFWWFGDYNPSQAVASFDQLFRLNIARLYEIIGLPPPAELDKPISHGGGHAEGGGTMRRAT